MKTVQRAALAAAFVVALAVVAASSQAQPGGKAKTHDQVVDAAIDYLKKAQAEDGTWSKAAHPGITGVVLTGLFATGNVTADDPMAAKALKYIESLVDAKEGHIANAEKGFHKNYLTSVNVAALKGSRGKYDAAIANAVAYLKKAQTDEGEEKKATDPEYGGFGYSSTTRPDLSNTHMVLDALKAGGVPKDDPVYKKAGVYVTRMQNYKGEGGNDQPWAGALNDGSFIYVAGGGRPGTGATPADAARPGYGSMTYAGLKSLLYCGATKDDPRVKKALDWARKNYSVDINPGRQEGAGGQGYFYYLVAMAKALDALGEDEFVDAAGKKHNWREDITRALTLRQKPNGSWVNDFPIWMESNPDLDTGFALMALSLTRPKTP